MHLEVLFSFQLKSNISITVWRNQQVNWPPTSAEPPQVHVPSAGKIVCKSSNSSVQLTGDMFCAVPRVVVSFARRVMDRLVPLSSMLDIVSITGTER